MLRFEWVFSLIWMLSACSGASAEDWRQWRGPTGDNHAPVGATAPTRWSDTSGLAWRTPLPGRGHASPTIVGERIYLITADVSAETQSLLILDRATGKLLREIVVHRGNLPKEIHPNNSHASSTVASDGQRLFTLFYNGGASWVTTFDRQGERLWQKKVAPFDPQAYQFGFGSSPCVVDGKLIVATEYDGPGSGLYALDPATGEQLWETLRTEGISFSTPAVMRHQGESQLLLSGRYLLASYAPATGEERWSVEGSASCTCGTMAWDKASGLAFASGGYPETFTLAVCIEGDHQIVWKNNTKCYEQSLLVSEGYVYGFADSGVLYCWRGTDGQMMWKERLGGPVNASPLLVDGHIYATNEEGTTFVFRATPERFERIAENQLGTDCFPSLTPADGRLYHRYGDSSSGERQEYLVAIGE